MLLILIHLPVQIAVASKFTNFVEKILKSIPAKIGYDAPNAWHGVTDFAMSPWKIIPKILAIFILTLNG